MSKRWLDTTPVRLSNGAHVVACYRLPKNRVGWQLECAECFTRWTSQPFKVYSRLDARLCPACARKKACPAIPDSKRSVLSRARIDKAVAVWISTKDRLPAPGVVCDWLFPATELKYERWILCNESILSASVPGRATHWRSSEPLPAAEGCQGVT